MYTLHYPCTILLSTLSSPKCRVAPTFRSYNSFELCSTIDESKEITLARFHGNFSPSLVDPSNWLNPSHRRHENPKYLISGQIEIPPARAFCIPPRGTSLRPEEPFRLSLSLSLSLSLVLYICIYPFVLSLVRSASVKLRSLTRWLKLRRRISR